MGRHIQRAANPVNGPCWRPSSHTTTLVSSVLTASRHGRGALERLQVELDRAQGLQIHRAAVFVAGLRHSRRPVRVALALPVAMGPEIRSESCRADPLRVAAPRSGPGTTGMRGHWCAVHRSPSAPRQPDGSHRLSVVGEEAAECQQADLIGHAQGPHQTFHAHQIADHPVGSGNPLQLLQGVAPQTRSPIQGTSAHRNRSRAASLTARRPAPAPVLNRSAPG